MNGSQGLQLARAALRVLTGAGGGTPARSALEARLRVHVEDRLRSGALGTAVLTKLREEPGDASTAIAVPVLADEISRDPAFGDTLNDLLEQLLGGPAAVAAYAVPPPPTTPPAPPGASPAAATTPGPTPPPTSPPTSPPASTSTSLGSIGLGAMTANAIPFQPPPPPPAPPMPVAPPQPQVIVIRETPPRKRRTRRELIRSVFMLGLPQCLGFTAAAWLVIRFEQSLAISPILLVMWLLSLLMALFGLIRGFSLLRGPFSLLLTVGMVLDLVILGAEMTIGIQLLAGQGGKI
ncbi:hypothetical protein [Streptomyces sp. NBC_00354]|uniref:hypothetical protein n=1 Tax=Streptomyces sp. NBC_00354 TaxID=2975723 RepID=UPI002E25E000